MRRWSGIPASLAWIGLLALLAPLVPSPVDSPHWHGLRTVVFEAGSAALLPILLLRSRPEPRRLTAALPAVPLCFLLALLAWGCLSAFLAPDKLFAEQGLLQLGAGTLVAFVIAADARQRPQYQILLDALIGATLLISFSGFALYGQDHVPLAVGFYHDHQLFGAVFTILLPLMLAISLSPVSEARRLAAQAALVSGLIALGLAETRSSWIGAAVALIVFGGLFWFARAAAPHSRPSAGEQRARRVQVILLSIVGLCALGYFLVAAPQTGRLAHRLQTLTTTVPQGREDSVQWRFSAWQGAVQMIRQKPALGWGIGCYPRYQAAFTGQGLNIQDGVVPMPVLVDEAHNSYLQLAAEMGLPALLLWLGVLASAFVQGFQALRRFTPGGLRQRALIGCLAALAGQATDAAANPGWQFGEVSFFLWTALGLTAALSLGVADPVRREQEHHAWRPGKALLALMIGAGLLWLIQKTAFVLPAPKL